MSAGTRFEHIQPLKRPDDSAQTIQAPVVRAMRPAFSAGPAMSVRKMRAAVPAARQRPTGRGSAGGQASPGAGLRRADESKERKKKENRDKTRKGRPILITWGGPSFWGQRQTNNRWTGSSKTDRKPCPAAPGSRTGSALACATYAVVTPFPATFS